MNYALRRLFFHTKYFKQKPGRTLLPLSQVQNLEFHSSMVSMIKSSLINLFPKAFPTNDFKFLNQGLQRVSKFEEFIIPTSSTYGNATQGQIINAFLNISKAYLKCVNQKRFESDLRNFTNSKNFQGFCTLLESKLPQMTPIALITLYDLIYYPKLNMGVLHNKICVMILETINNFTVLEKLHIYTKVSKNYSKHVESNNIKKVCETYFEKCLEIELSRVDICGDLLVFAESDAVPKNIRQLITEKLINDVCLNKVPKYTQAQVINLFTKLSTDMIPKNALKKIIKKLLYEYSSGELFSKIIHHYKKLCEKDESFYCEDMMQMILNTVVTKAPKRNIYRIIHNVSLMGHKSDHLINIALEILFDKNVLYMNTREVSSLIEVFIISCFQDTYPEEDVNKVRRFYESLKDSEKWLFPDLCRFCVHSTYLGCDTRALCSNIFKRVTEDSEVTFTVSSVLDLHHLAKACLSSGYEVLSEKTLHRLQMAEFKSNGALPSENLNEYFNSEDFVLKNCTTSEKHCLDFLAIFDSDNKPIDLSIYKKPTPKKNFLNIDEIKKPQGHKMIVFQKLRYYYPIKFLNHPSMTGAAKMQLKIFENLDCKVILLPTTFFTSTPEKKEEFLRSHIKDTLGNLEVKAE